MLISKPLSQQQRHLITLLPYMSDYKSSCVVQLDGTRSANSVKQLVTDVFQQHAILRSRFQASTYKQHIAECCDINFKTKKINSQEVDSLLEKIIAELTNNHLINIEEYTLSQIDVTLLRVDNANDVIIFAISPLLADFHSLNILARAFIDAYENKPMIDSQVCYLDYISVQQDNTVDNIAIDNNWQLHFPWEQSNHGKNHTQCKKIDLANSSIKAFCTEQGTAIATFLLTCWQILIWRLTGNNSFAIDVFHDGRNFSVLKNSVGLFSSWIPLDCSLDSSATFSTLFARMTRAYTKLSKQQTGNITESYTQTCIENYNKKLYPVCFEYHNTEDTVDDERTTIDVKSITTRFKLNLAASLTQRSITLKFYYDSERFTEHDIDRIITYYKLIQTQAINSPDKPISTLPISNADKVKLIDQWNDTAQPFQQDKTFYQLVEQMALNHPDSVAIECGNSTITYGVLDSQANRLAQYLQQNYAIGLDDRIGIIAERNENYVLAVLAVAKSGAAFVPIPPSYPKKRMEFIIHDANIKLLLCDDNNCIDTHIPLYNMANNAGTLNAYQYASAPPNVCISPLNLAYVIYTSGTTGTPKGVAVSHYGLVNLSEFHQHTHHVTTGRRILQYASIGFDASIPELLSLSSGTTLCMLPSDDLKISDKLMSWLLQRDINIASFTPTLLASMPDDTSPRLDMLILGGEACPRDLAKKWSSKTTLYNVYGPTESTVCTTAQRITPDTTYARPPIGHPISNIQTYVLDANQNLIPPGVIGELYIGGVGLARGYLNKPGLTAECFLPNPYDKTKGARMYKTGDRVRYLRDGAIEFLGRVDNQIKLRGFRIELDEVEALLNQNQSVKQCAVALQSSHDNTSSLIAYIVKTKTIQPGEHTYEQESIDQWRNVFNTPQYQSYSNTQDHHLNIVGWNSSYTGEAIPQLEMEEWQSNTLSRIKALNTDQILEIGCGSGLLLFPLMDYCSTYYATDFSNEVIQYLENVCQQQGIQHKVNLTLAEAKQLPNFDKCDFSTVIINSVVQYFPHIEYLIQTVKNAVNLVADGGKIFIGDVRNLNLLSAFYASIKLYNTTDKVSATALKKWLDVQITSENELLISPAFFTLLQQHLPQISDVEIMLKRGKYLNEMTTFRYDVILHKNCTTEKQTVKWLDWQQQSLSLNKVKHLLQTNTDDCIGFLQVPNARLAKEIELLTFLNEKPNADYDFSTISERNTSSYIDPEALYSLAESLPYSVHMSWAANYSDGSFDVAFRRVDDTYAASHSTQLIDFPTLASYNSIEHYTNSPAQRNFTTRLITQLHDYLSDKLPSYMIPARFVFTDSLPLNINGKIDRKSLLELENSVTLGHQTYVAPRNQIETSIVNIWQQLLGIGSIGINDNFFELGGHSLLVTQAVSRLNALYKKDLSVSHFFEAPTVASLASIIEQAAYNLYPQIPELISISRAQPLTLSYTQLRLWFLNQLEPDSAFYNISSTIRLDGVLNLEALEYSWNEVVKRHEILRTIYGSEEGKPKPIILPHEKTTIPIVSLQHLNKTEAELHAKQMISALENQPFNLAEGPLAFISIAQLAANTYIGIISMHHIAADGWSMGLLVREIGTLYNAYIEKEPSSLPDLPIQYVDYAHWQTQHLKPNVLHESLNYWRHKLAHIPALLNLPTDKPRPAIQQFKGARYVSTIDSTLTASLNKISKKEGVTLFMLLLAVFKVLLYRYTNQNHIVVGTATANRDHPELENLIGSFVNTLVLHTDLSGELVFTDILQRVKETAIQAFDHQLTPFEKIVETLQPERSLSYSPIFQIWFALQNAPINELQLSGLNLHYETITASSAKFDLSLSITEQKNSIIAEWEYSTDLFEQASIERLANDYHRLLNTINQNLHCKPKVLPLLKPQDYPAELIKNHVPHNDSMQAQLAKHVEQSPDAIAIICHNDYLTYQGLDQKVQQLAYHLQCLGISSDHIIGIHMHRSIELVISILAVMRTGAAYLLLDPNYPEKRLEFMLLDTGTSTVITQRGKQHNRLKHCVNNLITIEDSISHYSEQPTILVNGNPHENNLAYVIYTSGSTGQPKGVQISRKSLNNFLLSMQKQLGFKQRNKLLSITPISFDICMLEFLLPMMSGGTLVIAEQNACMDGFRMMQAVDNHTIDIMQATPATWQLLIDAHWQGNQGLTILCGGDVLTKELAQQLTPKGRALFNLYGPTETTIWSSCYGIDNSLSSMSIGTPIDNTQFYILDEQQNLAPFGVVGELYIGGEGLARGYINNPALTARQFIPDPFSQSGTRLYRTGDKARLFANGHIELLGRIDHQVKLRGFRIEIGEIEAALNEHSDVKQAAAVLKEAATNNKQLVAFIQPRQHLAKHELKSFLQKKLPDYMVPSLFIEIESLPVTSNGKIDRQALLSIAEQSTRCISKENYVPADTSIQKVLVSIWEDLLEVKPVGVNASFFAMGGHSLLAMQLLARLRKLFKVDLPVRALFQAETITDLETLLVSSEKSKGQLNKTAELLLKIEAMPHEKRQALLNKMKQPI